MSDLWKSAALNASRLVGRISGMIESGDRGSLAALRKGGDAAYHIVFPLIGETDNRSHTENVGLLIAQALGIMRRHHPRFGNFGRSMRSMWLSKDKTDGVKNRANRIIRSRDRKTLEREVTSMVRWMAASNIRIDFFQLYMDVYFWNERIARTWASTFYEEDV